MKKILIIFLLSILVNGVFSQTTGYGGLIYDSRATLASVRPYVNARMNEQWMGNNISYYPVVGAGMNTLGNISISGGFDLKKYFSEKSNDGIFCGFSVEVFGWEEVYKSFMPSLRVGIETKKIIILGTSNWKFKEILMGNQIALEPTIKPTVGIFYKING